jgi:hypothetical protein
LSSHQETSPKLTMEFPERECIPPTKENTKTSRDVETMFNSHSWDLKRAEPAYDNRGVLIRMSCRRCGAEKVAILEEDPEKEKLTGMSG